MSDALALVRIARRDAARARGRSTLICVMIALPVFALAFADVTARTADPDPDEVFARALGTAQYVLTREQPIGSGFTQAPDPTTGAAATGSARSGKPRYADLARLAPRGSRVLGADSTTVELRTR